VARALLKAQVGDEVAVQTPKGPQRIEVLAVTYPAPLGGSRSQTTTKAG
jgi:transcription elongation factor GreB